MPIGDFVKKDPDALDRWAESLLQRVRAEFADARLSSSSQPLGEVARGELFAARNLNVGQSALEIEGTDHEGKPFKLSETRGKVVVLTFSADWCGPCVAMYPQMRALLSKYQAKPFTIVVIPLATRSGPSKRNGPSRVGSHGPPSCQGVGKTGDSKS